MTAPAAETEIGVEENEIGGECFRRQFRPAVDRDQADGRQLPGDRLHRRVRAMQDERPGAAACAGVDELAARRVGRDRVRAPGAGSDFVSGDGTR